MAERAMAEREGVGGAAAEGEASVARWRGSQQDICGLR